MMAAAASIYGKEFDDIMKEFMKRDKAPGVMRSWYCRECEGFYADKGKPGCRQCTEFESASARARGEAA